MDELLSRKKGRREEGREAGGGEGGKEEKDNCSLVW